MIYPFWHGGCNKLPGYENQSFMNRIFTTIILSLACTGSFAQGLDLKECMRYALDRSAKVRIQEAEVDDARIARREAILKAFTPSLEAGSYAYSNFGRSVDPETNTYVSTT